MIRSHSQQQLSLSEFDWPFQVALDENNRWVKLSQCIPWDQLAESYYQGFSLSQGRPAKDARLVIGAVIIKHQLCLSDEETVAQIQENPYLQYFVGLAGYQMEVPFVPSLMVEIRKRMGPAVFDRFNQSIIDVIEQKKAASSRASKATESEHHDDDPPSGGVNIKASAAEPESEPDPQGKLILDATVAEQAIRFPTDLSLLNESREFSEQVIDILHQKRRVSSHPKQCGGPLMALLLDHDSVVVTTKTGDQQLSSEPSTEHCPQASSNKPRTYRQKARQAYLAIVKQRRPSANTRRRGIKQQLQYLRRNLGHIEQLLNDYAPGSPLPLPKWLLHRYWVIQHVFDQQWAMFSTKTRRCDNRIVSISQPYVRLIIRGKLNKPVEFGAKLSASLYANGLAQLDHLRWDAFHEGLDLESQVEAYRTRYGHYPGKVLGDPIYGTRNNRRYLKQHGILFAGKPLGRPPTETDANREQLKQQKVQRQQDYRQRIPIEGKFGQGKNGYGLNYIRAKRADTSVAWINSIFLVMNLKILIRIFFVCAKSWLVVIARAQYRRQQHHDPTSIKMWSPDFMVSDVAG